MIKLNVVHFALTGFGNAVLKALLQDARVNVQAVFTLKYDQPFPYYQERQLLDECIERGIACHYDVNVSSQTGFGLLKTYSPDLVIVSTFKQIIKKNVLALPPLGVINFHPSLLPKYRGPCPSNAALINNETVTGVTVHYMTEEVDEGDVLLQKSIPIEESDYDGKLRQKLAQLSASMVPEIIDMFAGLKKPNGMRQDHSLATLAPKPIPEDGHLENVADLHLIARKVRALNPIPGTSFLLGDRRVPVNRFSWLQDDRHDGIYDQDNAIIVTINSRSIMLYKQLNGDAVSGLSCSLSGTKL